MILFASHCFFFKYYNENVNILSAINF